MITERERPAILPPVCDELRLPDGPGVYFRPLAIEDDGLYPAFDARLTDEDRRLRFFSPAHLSTRQMARFTRFDRESAAAIVAVEERDGAVAGVARLHRLADGSGEFAVLVRSDLKGRGLGSALMERILAEAERIGVQAVVGLILRENAGMRHLARQLGFGLAPHPEDPALLVARLDP